MIPFTVIFKVGASWGILKRSFFALRVPLEVKKLDFETFS